MRIGLMTGTAALLLASALAAGAQETPPTSTPRESTSKGSIDVGGRFTDVEGDEARYERYRDLRNGANLNLLYSRETEDWTFDLSAKNVGYRDQNYVARFNSRRVKASFSFDQTPLNYYYDARTPFDCIAGNCTLDAGLRARVENRTAVGVPSSVAQLGAGSAYGAISNGFDLRSRRDTMAGEARISATDHIDFTVDFTTYKRSGNMPWGAAFAFNNASEYPLVIDNRETDVSLGVEWASHQGMFRVAYQRSKFDQDIPTFRFDNPQRATDFCRPSANVPAGTCYDPSGYSNGNGPAFGLMAMAPSNSVNTFSSQAMVKLPGRTTANASLTMGANHQDAALIGWTSNPVINTPAVFAAFPELAHLPRDTAQMRVNHTTATANVSSRAIKDITLTAKYRYNSRGDFTRAFEAHEYVRFDAVPEETGGAVEPFNINRNTLDVNAAWSGIPRGTLRVGYGIDQLEHGVRTTQGWKDKTARASFDMVGNQYVTLRAMYEHTDRDTINLSEEALAHAAMQPAARFFDEAARTRNRGTFIVEVTPTSSIGVNLSVATGKDDYQDGDPTMEFGLLDNENTSITAGINYAPSGKVNLGLDYGREKFNSLQQSRNANPAPDPSWTDPSRNWTLENDETVNTLSAYLNLVKPVEKVDVSFGYEFMDSDQAFVHGGPRIPVLALPTAAAPGGTFVALPNVTNKWHQANVDLRYSVSEKLGFGVGYMFEKLDVEDFATINTAGPATLPRPELGAQTEDPRYDWLGSLITGYAARPYKGQTAFVRLFYYF